MSPAVVKGARPQHLRSKSSARPSPNSGRISQSESGILKQRRKVHVTKDAQGDAATAAFVRRVLCGKHIKPAGDGTASQQPLDQLLPPLTSSNEVDLQLYAIIAVIVKDFVQAWYARITPDEDFVDEVIQIIAHCTRGIEQRLRRVDLEALILDELPQLIVNHIEHARLAISASRADGGRSLGTDVRVIYHSLHPHPALSPVPVDADQTTIGEQQANETVWRQLIVERVLENLLPPQDLRNPCLRVLVGEIFSEMIIGNVLSAKMCEGWFLWEATSKAIQATTAAQEPSHTRVGQAANTEAEGRGSARSTARLDRYGLLETEDERRPTNGAGPRPRWRPVAGKKIGSVYALIINAVFELLRIIILIAATCKTLLTIASEAATIPSRLKAPVDGGPTALDAHDHEGSKVLSSKSGQTVTRENGAIAPHHGKVAIACMAGIDLPASLCNISTRMPWVSGLASLVRRWAVTGPGTVCGLDSRIDRYLSQQVTRILTAPSLLPTILRAARTALFSDNTFLTGAAPRPIPVTEAERHALRAECARSILALIPPAARAVYFAGATTATTTDSNNSSIAGEPEDHIPTAEAPDPATTNGAGQNKRDPDRADTPSANSIPVAQIRAVEADMLDLFADPYMNRHLIFAVLEVLLAHIFPEMVAEVNA